MGFTPTLIIPLKLLSLNCKPSYSFWKRKNTSQKKTSYFNKSFASSHWNLQQFPQDVLQKKKKKKKSHRKAFGDPQLHWLVKKRFRQSCFHASLEKFCLNLFCRTLLSVTSSPPDPVLLIFEIFPSPEIFFDDLSSEQLQGCSESHCKMHRKTTGNRDLFLSEL